MRLTAFLLRVAICFLLSLIPLHELENLIYSARVELRGKKKPAGNIVILDIDSRDFQELKGRLTTGPSGSADRMEGLRDLFYWDTSFFTEVLRRLLAEGPSAVVVSWYIPREIMESQSDPGLETLARSGNVIWSSQFDSDGKYLRPGSVVATRSNLGFNNLNADSDGIIRKGVLFRRRHPSLTWTTWTRFSVAVDPPNPFLINYMGPAGTVKTCRLASVLAGPGNTPCGQLKNKIVILMKSGDPSITTAVTKYGPNLGTPLGQPLGETPSFRTPMGEMSRAEILASEIDTIVNRRTIYTASYASQALIILALILAGAFYIIYYPVVISAIAISGTAFILVGIVFQVLFHVFDVYIPSANITASLLITYLVFTGYRLAFQEHLQWRTLKQAQYLRELDQMKSNFLSLVSHDLKTPLAKIQAVVERLRRESSLPAEKRTDMRDLLDSIENSNNELKHYITSILNLSRIESQKVILNKKSNDINRIIQLTLRRLRPFAHHKGITIEESLEPLFSVECDEDLMRQVLTNLVDNAIKYSPAQSKIILRSQEEDGLIRVDVEDHGPGIPKDQLPLVFRKFHRFVRPDKDQVKGTGLGLYLSKYFIELHGGSIRVQSEEGKGTVFTFTLPLHESGSV